MQVKSGLHGVSARAIHAFSEEVEKVVALIVATPADIAERYAKAFASQNP